MTCQGEAEPTCWDGQKSFILLTSNQMVGDVHTKSPTVWSGPNQLDPVYLLTVEVQDRRVPGSLSGPGDLQGPGRAVELGPVKPSVRWEGQHCPLIPLNLLPSLGSESLGSSLSRSLPGGAPPFTLTSTNESRSQAEPALCRSWLSQQGALGSLCISLRLVVLPRTAFRPIGPGWHAHVPSSTSPGPCGALWPSMVYLCWVVLPPKAPLMDPWSVSCGAWPAKHTLTSRGSRGGVSWAGCEENSWAGGRGWRVTSCRAWWAVERGSQGLPLSVEETQGGKQGNQNTETRWTIASECGACSHDPLLSYGSLLRPLQQKPLNLTPNISR